MFKTKKRLLLLDDDPSMQRLMAAVLRRAGFRVDVVSSGDAAIEKLDRVEYAALLLDLMTPTEGGLTVVRYLKKSRAELLRRVILVTGSPESVLKTVAGDVAAVVHKPFTPEQLLKAVHRVVR